MPSLFFTDSNILSLSSSVVNLSKTDPSFLSPPPRNFRACRSGCCFWNYREKQPKYAKILAVFPVLSITNIFILLKVTEIVLIF